jgi:hypothetical protein
VSEPLAVTGVVVMSALPAGLAAGRRRGQADIVLVFPLGQDHTGRGVDQAGEHEALDVRYGVEQRFGLIENHSCFLPRGGQAWGTQTS